MGFPRILLLACLRRLVLGIPVDEPSATEVPHRVVLSKPSEIARLSLADLVAES